MKSIVVGVLAVFWASFAVAQEDVSPPCEAAMDYAAARYGHCLLRADGRYAVTENQTVRDSRQQRCKRRYDRQTSRAVRLFKEASCPMGLLHDVIAERTATYAASVKEEASGNPLLSLLFVQSSRAGMLTESELTLTDVNDHTGWFSERPHNVAGQMPTDDFVGLFGIEAPDSFSNFPPNADLTCEVDGDPVNQVVTLTNPFYGGGTLTYDVALIDSKVDDGDPVLPILCDGPAHLLIDDYQSAQDEPIRSKCLKGSLPPGKLCATCKARYPSAFFPDSDDPHGAKSACVRVAPPEIFFGTKNIPAGCVPVAVPGAGPTAQKDLSCTVTGPTNLTFKVWIMNYVKGLGMDAYSFGAMWDEGAINELSAVSANVTSTNYIVTNPGPPPHKTVYSVIATPPTVVQSSLATAGTALNWTAISDPTKGYAPYEAVAGHSFRAGSLTVTAAGTGTTEMKLGFFDPNQDVFGSARGVNLTPVFRKATIHK